MSRKKPKISALGHLPHKIRKAIGQYFFKEIVEKGKILYDTGRFLLAEMRMLTNKEYKALVTKDFEYWRERAEAFLKSHQHDMSDASFRNAAFHLHQVCESNNCSSWRSGNAARISTACRRMMRCG